MSLTVEDMRIRRERLLQPRKRWNYGQKVDAVLAVRVGLVSFGELRKAHGLSNEEFLAWCTALDRHGTFGLRATPEGLRRSISA